MKECKCGKSVPSCDTLWLRKGVPPYDAQGLSAALGSEVEVEHCSRITPNVASICFPASVIDTFF